MRKWIVTLGGAGMIPVAPGTWGSLVTAGALWLAYVALAPGFVGWNAILLGGMALTGALCVLLGPWAIAYSRRKDPAGVVLDEAAGVCVAMLFLPMFAGGREWLAAAAAFVAFRVFDIWKPYPIRKLEELPAGWGILADDLLAGVYANVVCQMFLRWIA